MSDVRTEMIDDAVAHASELVGLLQEQGPISPAQAQLLVMAAVRAKVSNIKEFEVREGVKRVCGQLEKEAVARGKPLGGDNENQSGDVR